MPRFIILGVVLAVAFTLYSLVDAAMTDARRMRGVSKPVWVVICVVLPVIGGILWLTVGKGDGRETVRPVLPDDDPGFGGMSPENVDERIADLEAQLRALDDEVFPGETPSEGDSGEANPDATEGGSQPETDADPKPDTEDGTDR